MGKTAGAPGLDARGDDLAAGDRRDVLCAILDRRAAPAALAESRAAAAIHGGRVAIVSSHSIQFAWANPLAGLIGVPTIGNPAVLARDEVAEFAADLGGEVDAVWIEEPERLRDVVKARLSEGTFSVVVIGRRGGGRRLGRVGRDLRAFAEPGCTVIEVD